MEDSRREQLITFVKNEFIGPDPIDWEGLRQENGEEILVSDPPGSRYIAGILYPRESLKTEVDSAINSDMEIEDDYDDQNEYNTSEPDEKIFEYPDDAEDLINRSNSYNQSALSITVAIADEDRLCLGVSAGVYHKKISMDLKKEKTKYYRESIKWESTDSVKLPGSGEGMVAIPVTVKGEKTGLQIDITYRMKNTGFNIYTITLENTKEKTADTAGVNDEDCFFQVELYLRSQIGFHFLPDSTRINADDEYKSNQLLYRNVHNYAIGHGCGVDWDDEEPVRCISSAVFPSYEVKPVVPKAIDGVSLSMKDMGNIKQFNSAIEQLSLMCEKYLKWIEKLNSKIDDLSVEYTDTAKRHMDNCMLCYDRMVSGIELLKSDKTVRRAFQWMNEAMLLQQLHYSLPLQKWRDDGTGNLILDNPVEHLPVIEDESTWYDSDNRVYGKWRPFQIAFILMNLRSIYDKNSNERQIVDLIWFPTGGGKTEAYLGLSAYTIFIRRLQDKNDSGTSIIMRYTLRLLTAQQYERASSMICACEVIRKAHADLLGGKQINIGLWVGGDTTPNKHEKANSDYEKLLKGESAKNPFVILKCPWCGAEMGPVDLHQSKTRTFLQGYKREVGPRKTKRFAFKCSNSQHNCDFSKDNLPLYVIDEDIYEKTPTLILGTVDKFAMLPFKPEAQRIFGYYNGIKKTSPDLIIQDELHLISGPLGSMVGHYETMIKELCRTTGTGSDIYPKVIASTATISRAKEQCHALYGCDRKNVFQFPPSGLDAGNSFFAEEDSKQTGRKYVGVFASNSPSDATTAIWLYAALLYGAKTMDVDSEEKRDPYWTNIGYYNSIRELGQARTWIKADIDQHLDIMYKRRYDDKRLVREEYRKYRRYISRDEELTSRIPGDRVTQSLANLAISYPQVTDKSGKIKESPIDISLATNMISVGLDVPRLGLMTVAGQPKTTSEYIQATSRVGRDSEKAPGLIFILYRPGRPRDKSYYEQFRAYHSKLYCNVEPTSVTPFSAPVRERALHAIIIGIMRLELNDKFNENPPILPDEKMIKHIKAVIREKILQIEPDELEDTLNRVEFILQSWEDWCPQCWSPEMENDGKMKNAVPLIYGSGNVPNKGWNKRGLRTPTSMRNVDSSCEAEVLPNGYNIMEE